MVEVAIIEDVPEIREGLAALINGQEGFRCRQRYRTMEEALEGIGAALPQIALVDLGLPGMSGLAGIRALKERHPSLTIVVLTVYGDDERIFEALCAGASGYLLKKTPPARLIEGLHEAAAGASPMSPEVARSVIRLFHQFKPAPPLDHDLTPHELRLLGLLVGGHNYKTAAALLKVSVNTIAFHMRSIYSKLHVHSKAEAVAKALRHRLLG